jgi:hypothetical protein
MSDRYASGFAAYVQAACNCRKGYMCSFCRRWLAPPRKTSPGKSRREGKS